MNSNDDGGGQRPERRPQRQAHNSSDSFTKQEESLSSQRPPEPANITPNTDTNTSDLAARACDSCRQRKAKCSRTKPSCTQCQGLKLKCTYSG